MTKPGEAVTAGTRWRPAGWKEPRLIVGLVLLLVSVLGVVGLVRAAERTQAVYAARSDLPVGTVLTPEHLDVVEVRLGEQGGAYLSAQARIEPGTTVIASIGRGELVPQRHLGPDDGTGRRPMSIQLDGPNPVGVVAGARVDVYASEQGSAARLERTTARLLLSSVEVTEVTRPQDGLGADGDAVVHVLVDPDDVAGLVTARGAGDRLDVVALPPGAHP